MTEADQGVLPDNALELESEGESESDSETELSELRGMAKGLLDYLDKKIDYLRTDLNLKFNKCCFCSEWFVWGVAKVNDHLWYCHKPWVGGCNQFHHQCRRCPRTKEHAREDPTEFDEASPTAPIDVKIARLCEVIGLIEMRLAALAKAMKNEGFVVCRKCSRWVPNLHRKPGPVCEECCSASSCSCRRWMTLYNYCGICKRCAEHANHGPGWCDQDED